MLFRSYRVDSAFTNSPVVVAAQLYATLMRQSPRMHSLGKALTASLLGLAEHGPGLISTEDALSKLKESRGGSLVGGLISEYEPSILKRAAAARDLQPGTGTPMGYFIGGKGKPVKRMNDTAISQIRQGIMSPLPYNRNELPTQASQSEASSGEGKHYGRHGRSRGIPRR